MKSYSITKLTSGLKSPTLPLAAPILILYIFVGIFLVPTFISVTNITSILFTVAVLLPAVIGTQLLLVLGKFDLSVGATASLAGMVAGIPLSRSGSLAAAICLSLLIGALVGCINGVLVSRLRIDPLIVTLAMMGIARSLSLVINDGQIVAGLTNNFGLIVEARFAGIPILILFALVFACTIAVVTGHLVIFRRFYAVGNNAMGASHAGVNIAQIVTFGYILAGIGAAMTGLIQASRTLSASPLLFDTLAIEIITACILGGSALSGGRGGVLGAILGLIVVSATNNLVVMIGIPVYWKEFAIGLLLLLAVLGKPILVVIKSSYIKLSPMTTGIRELYIKFLKGRKL